MDDPEASSFSEAEHRWESGDVKGAIDAHLNLCINGRDAKVSLDSALVLVERLNPVDRMPMILQVCDIGMERAETLQDSLTKAYLMGKKAETLAFLTGLRFVPERKTLRIAPGWFGFSLERDENRFKDLTKTIEANSVEVDGLRAKALEITERAGSHSTKAQVFLCEGRVHASRYMDLKVECLKGRAKAPKILIRLLRPYRFDDFIVFTAEERTKMNKCLNLCEASHIAAADEFRKDGDESGIGYAYYNLANHLRTAFRFNRAKKYLHLAKHIAERHRDDDLLSSVKLLEQTIRARNRDIPNYLAGERRDNLR